MKRVERAEKGRDGVYKCYCYLNAFHEFIQLVLSFGHCKSHFPCSNVVHKPRLIWNADFQIWIAATYPLRKAVQLFFYYSAQYERGWHGLLYDVRCTRIINNLFSVEVHIETDACWLASFGRMAALICSSSERTHRMHFKEASWTGALAHHERNAQVRKRPASRWHCLMVFIIAIS